MWALEIKPCGSHNKTMKNDIEYKILKVLERNPKMTQRQLAQEIGVSLGQTHYVIRALIERGMIKLENFTNSNNKVGYLYLLTPRGIAEKTTLAKSFLIHKQKEYQLLRFEIEELKKESK